MPTLIRLVVIVLVLAGLGYGGMLVLVNVVEPKQHEVTIRIPARELLKAPERAPVTRREINTSRSPAEVPAPAAADTAPVEPVPAEDGAVKTLSPGVE